MDENSLGSGRVDAPGCAGDGSMRDYRSSSGGSILSSDSDGWSLGCPRGEGKEMGDQDAPRDDGNLSGSKENSQLLSDLNRSVSSVRHC